MAEETDLYCRLCAEPTPLVQLITPKEEVAFTSKIIMKLSWINIDISSPNGLPNTICFSCFDLLERTWSFLNNVRTSQDKLAAIFLKSTKQTSKSTDSKTKESNSKIPGKPVDENWDDFQKPKLEIKIENYNEKVTEVTNQHSVIISDDNGVVKAENDIDDDFLQADSNNGFLSSSDSDVPLKKIKKKKVKRKQTAKDSITFDDNSELPIDILSFNITWENQTCRCAKCDALCKSILSLQLHSLEIHNQCCMFKCIDCEKILNSYRAFVRHLRSHNSALRHCCEYCNKIFTLPSEVKNHKVKEHRDVYKTKCTYCGANFETAEELEEHKTMFFKDSSKKMKKIKVNGDSKEHKCDHCNKVFKSRPNLVQHKVLHTERSRNFACHVCGKMFYTKGSLGTHMITHDEIKPYKCDHCPLAFRARGNLISHMSLHSGLKPFICEQCGKSFRVKRHLVSHAIVHTDLRPYVCEYCNKAFRFKTRLNLHFRQHTGVKPYKCIYCQRDFTNGSNYKKHMSRRHGIDTSSRIKINVVNKNDLNESSETAV
ncbi:unnamed protein product, partial [Brenthis ino]